LPRIARPSVGNARSQFADNELQRNQRMPVGTVIESAECRFTARSAAELKRQRAAC
jgi:hypothetical protein